MKRIKLLALILLSCALSVNADVVVTPSVVIGPIKPMNATNNGPTGPASDGVNHQTRDNYETFRAAGIPYARTHDSSFSLYYGGEHTVDITAIFPDFSKDADDPKSYDFVMTDFYLKRIRMVGTEVYFRLGQKIEHGPKKYGIIPPKDYKKWAKICEHIIRHYNEGWADGFHWNIRYWEIWNEADGDEKKWKYNAQTWAGPEEEFFKMYAIAAKHLKKCFPNLMIGGPAISGNVEWGERFLAYMSKESVPIDFFSWHMYDWRPEIAYEKSHTIRNLMKKYGYGDKECHLNEWNYLRNFEDKFPYSIVTMSNIKGAAFCAAVMSRCQDAPVDMLMYYDARPETPFNGLFDMYTLMPLPPYYTFYAWSKLAKLGTQVQAKIENDNERDIYATAATGKNGKTMAMVIRFNEDDNVCHSKSVKVKLEGCTADEVIGHVVDRDRNYTEIPLLVQDGAVTLAMQPNSIFTIEW